MESYLQKIKNDKYFSFTKTEDLSDDEVAKAKDILKNLGYI